MALMFSAGIAVQLDGPVIPKAVTPKMAWEGPEGQRRPSKDTPELDEHGRPGFVVDADMPLGREGAVEKVGVTVWTHEVPELTWVDFHTTQVAMPVEFDGLRMYVRPAKTGKGIEVSMTADGVRTVGAGRSSGRRGAAAQAAESTEQTG